MSLRRFAAGAVVASILTAGCSGESAPSEPTNPINGLTAEQEQKHSQAIQDLAAERDALTAQLEAEKADLERYLAALAPACRAAVQQFRWGNELEQESTETAQAKIEPSCQANLNAVAQVRYADAEIIADSIRIGEVVWGIGANLGALGVEPPTTLG